MTGPVVHTYRAAESGLLVNSYLVEGEQGIVVVDTNLLLSDIAALRARLEALHKPLRAIFVTHPHPDHFNGVLALVRGSEVPVYATADVGRVIMEIAAAKRAQWSPVYGQEWPAGRLSGSLPRLPDAARAELGAAMRAFLPDAPLTSMIELGADAVAAVLAGAGVRQDALHAAWPLRAAGQRAGPGHHDVRDGLGLGRVGERERQAV